MNIEEVKLRIRTIKSNSGNDEYAHSMEDSLYLDVLTAIAQGSTDASALAGEAIKTKHIEFFRWFS